MQFLRTVVVDVIGQHFLLQFGVQFVLDVFVSGQQMQCETNRTRCRVVTLEMHKHISVERFVPKITIQLWNHTSNMNVSTSS